MKVLLVDYAYFEDVKGFGVIAAEHEVLNSMFREGLLAKFRHFSKVPKGEVESYLAKAEKLMEPVIEKLRVEDPSSVLYVYGSEDEVLRLIEMIRPRLVVVEDSVAGRFERELESVEGVDVVKLSEALEKDVSLDMGALELPKAVTEALFNMLSTYTNLVVRVCARERIGLDEALARLGLYKRAGQER